MMVENKESNQTDVKDQKVEPLSFGGQTGMVCDFETGICGPVSDNKTTENEDK